MGKYTFKLLELIELSNEKLKVRLTIDESEKLYILHVDKHTYDSINSAVNSFEEYYSRLSLITKRNPFNHTYTSSITLIRGKETRKLSFNCDETYARLIEKIRDADSFEELNIIDELVELVEEKESQPKTKPIVESNVAEVEPEQISNDKAKATPTKKTDCFFSKLFRNMLIASVAIILIVLFKGDYFSANESKTVQLVQGSQLLTPPIKSEKPSITVEQQVEDEVGTVESSIEEKDEIEIVDQEEKLPSQMAFYEVDEVTYQLPEGYVALTFDDGPSIYTKQIVDLLTEYEVAGTFFFVGDQVLKHPEYVTYTNDKGHVVASHSQSHKNITTLYEQQLDEEILQSIIDLEKVSGSNVNLFRPPYGAIGEFEKAFLSENNVKTIMWNRDPRDWDVSSKDAIINYFYELDPSGGIYILHENKYTLEALPEIIEYLKELNLEIVGIQ
ncbi:polysaccharide deacetylase family protein [Bacillaceae bacterium W0354]